MGLTELPPVESGQQRSPRSPDDYQPMQAVTRAIALSPDGFDDRRREQIRRLFDEMAPEWHTRGGADRLAPTIDALDRGRVAGGRALEIGSGTGLQTPPLAERFEEVVSVDLSHEMIVRSPRRERVHLLEADGSRLPLRDGTVDAVVCVNAYLFPAEYDRVLRPGGAVVMVATSGEETPIYLPPADVVAALETAMGPVEATWSRHGFGVWTVARKVA